MNTYVHPAHTAPPHDLHRTAASTINDAAGPYRPAPGPPYSMPMPHAMGMPTQGAYGEQYNPLSGARPPIPDGLHVQIGEGMVAMREPVLPDPPSKAYVEGNRRYELSVVQQPQRARMCGFGDKDRRPITPPPCVRLIITDILTGKEVDVNEIEHGMYVLNVDLWSADGTREVNLVRHSATSPQISSTTPASYGQIEPNAPAYSTVVPGQPPRDQRYEHGLYGTQGSYNPYPGPPQVSPYAQTQSPQSATSYASSQYGPSYSAGSNGSSAYPPQNGYQGSQPYYPPGSSQYHRQSVEYSPATESLPSAHSVSSYGGRPFTPSELRLPVNTAQPTGMFTRNLIGSLAASAFRLTDPDDRIGIWFVLQDLSVRTEGSFRLRFSFVNVGRPSTPDSSSSANASSNNPHSHPSSASNTNTNSQQLQPPQNQSQSSLVNTGRAPVLASCFSAVFTVYSAKKFPGVVESTHLSKCFATQGIKIPIRKDTQSGGNGKRGPGHGGGDDFDDD